MASVVVTIIVAEQGREAVLAAPTVVRNVFRRYFLLVGFDDLVPAPGQCQRDPLLVAVDVVEGLNLTVVADRSREIDDVYRDRLVQADLVFFGTLRDKVI